MSDTLRQKLIDSLLRFCDQSYFTAVFRRQTGLTPGEYRKTNQR